MLLNVNLLLPIKTQNFLYALNKSSEEIKKSTLPYTIIEESNTVFKVYSKYTNMYLATFLQPGIYSN